MLRRWSRRWWTFLVGTVVIVVGAIGLIASLVSHGDGLPWLVALLVGVVVQQSVNPFWRNLGRSKNGPPGQS